MPTSLIVEDGTGVTGANSYVAYNDALTWCNARGFVMGADQPSSEKALIMATDYLEAQRNRYQGRKTNDPTKFTLPIQQPLQWPRDGVFIDAKSLVSFQVLNGFDNLVQAIVNASFPKNAIPVELINAQIMLAKNVADGVTLFPTQNGPFVTMKKLGPLEKHFSEIINTSIEPDMLAVNAWLAPLMQDQSGYSLSSVRI